MEPGIWLSFDFTLHNGARLGMRARCVPVGIFPNTSVDRGQHPVEVAGVMIPAQLTVRHWPLSVSPRIVWVCGGYVLSRERSRTPWRPPPGAAVFVMSRSAGDPA